MLPQRATANRAATCRRRLACDDDKHLTRGSHVAICTSKRAEDCQGAYAVVRAAEHNVRMLQSSHPTVETHHAILGGLGCIRVSSDHAVQQRAEEVVPAHAARRRRVQQRSHGVVLRIGLSMA